MSKVLVLGQHNLITQTVVKRLKLQSRFEVLTFGDKNPKLARNYLPYLQGVNIIASFLGPMDLDLDFEALFEAIHKIHPPLKQFLMLSTAGIDHEVQGPQSYPGVKDLKEYFNEQRYAIKVVDEEEVPYTILRPVEIIKTPARFRPRIIEEGNPVPAGQISYQNVAKVALDVIEKHCYLNQSIAVVNK